MMLPKHLEPLMDGTPLAIERIKLAWPALPSTDRALLIIVLLADPMEGNKALRWVHHRNYLIDLALEDESAYVRYLAAKWVYEPLGNNEGPSYLDEKARFNKVKSDPVLTVRSAVEEDGPKIMWSPGEPELFWKLPHTDRLAIVNDVNQSGEKIAGLLRYAAKDLLPIKAIEPDEVLDVLLQYLGGKSIAERVAESEDYARRYGEGYEEYCLGNSVRALWEVIPDLPRGIAIALLESLPDHAGLEADLPELIIDSLDEYQLEALMFRSDIRMEVARRKTYKESANKGIRHAAVSSLYFRLEDSDISRLVYDSNESIESGKKKFTELCLLAENCLGATLVQMQAICDLIERAPLDFHSGVGQYYAIGAGQELRIKRAKSISLEALRDEVVAMRLYMAAVEMSAVEELESLWLVPKEKLKQYLNMVVRNNPWQTYLNLSKALTLEHLKKHPSDLPNVYIRGLGLPEDLMERVGTLEAEAEGLSDNALARLGKLRNTLNIQFFVIVVLFSLVLYKMR